MEFVKENNSTQRSHGEGHGFSDSKKGVCSNTILIFIVQKYVNPVGFRGSGLGGGGFTNDPETLALKRGYRD